MTQPNALSPIGRRIAARPTLLSFSRAPAAADGLLDEADLLVEAVDRSHRVANEDSPLGRAEILVLAAGFLHVVDPVRSLAELLEEVAVPGGLLGLDAGRAEPAAREVQHDVIAELAQRRDVRQARVARRVVDGERPHLAGIDEFQRVRQL